MKEKTLSKQLKLQLMNLIAQKKMFIIENEVDGGLFKSKKG